jgi:hypothetical protein
MLLQNVPNGPDALPAASAIPKNPFHRRAGVKQSNFGSSQIV